MANNTLVDVLPGRRRIRLALALSLLAIGSAQGQETRWEGLDNDYDREVLVIESTDKGCFRFDIHLALSGAQQRRGLMHIRELPEWAGMLFVYRRAGIRSMWMKNTYVPLDIVFARADGAVSSVEANTVPQSLESITSTEPVNYVLELNAGTAARLGIGDGSRLIIERPD